MMQNIADFFGCCNKDAKEPNQITATFNERIRAHSLPSSRTARIKRSLGKDNKPDGNSRPHNNITALTLTCTRSSKLKSKQSKDMDSNSSIEQSYRQQHSSVQQIGEIGGLQQIIPNHLKSQKYEKVIDYVRQKNDIVKSVEENNRNFTELENLELNFEVPQIRTCTPRLLIERRCKKNTKQPEGISLISMPREEVQKISFIKTPFKATILEPIEERLSMPSCSSSQVRDSRQIVPFSSRTVHLSESGQLHREFSQLGLKHQSCIIQEQVSQCSPIRTGQSYCKAQSQLQQNEKDLLVQNKLRIDIQIFQNQLKALLDEQVLLKNQSIYSKNLFMQRLSHLEKIKSQLSTKMFRLDNEMKEMKKVISSKVEEKQKQK